MRDIVNWIKEIQENEKFAQKYKGVKDVQKIVELAKKDGYEISKSDIEEVSGGRFNFDFDVNVIVKKANVSATATGKNAIAQNNSTINM